MEAILDLLQGSQGRTLVDGASRQLGMDSKQTTAAVTAALPLILGALKNNASSEEGARGLMSAISDPRHSGGSVLDNLSSILGGDSIDNDVMTDGAAILGHAFRGQQQNAAGAVSKTAGIDMNKAMDLMKVAAPFVMAYLGKKSRESAVQGGSGLTDVLGGLLGNLGDAPLTAASRIQDFDNNDNTVDDIAEMLTGRGGGGLGSLVGGFLKNL